MDKIEVVASLERVVLELGGVRSVCPRDLQIDAGVPSAAGSRRSPAAVRVTE